ncbi:MAG: efflux RND transporter periplasmic adaptor subunit [Pirellulales bacterium]|nr:efflux RND transporter periplasmic adaptor subunit [Pirellulales bacterium]
MKRRWCEVASADRFVARRGRMAWAAAGACLLLLLAGCHETASEQANDAPLVRVTTPVERDVIDYVFFTGRTEAVSTIEIRARVTGYLVSVDFVSGGEVKAKQRLFKIDPRPYQAALDQANGQIKLNEAQLKLAQADYARALEIAKTPGAISQQDIDTYAAKEAEAAAALEAAKANAEAAALNVEFTDVITEIDGIVGRNLLTDGNLVSQDNTLLTTVVSQDPIYTYFDVDENTMLRIRRLIEVGELKGVEQGARVPVQMALADEKDRYPHEGYIDFVNNMVDANTGTLQVRGVFPNPKPAENVQPFLRPGMFVRVRVPLGDAHPALLLPQMAVASDQGKPYLLVVNQENVVEYRPIELGAEEPGGWQVVIPVKVVKEPQGFRMAREDETGEDSIKAGDSVIVSGLQRARPNSVVRTKPYELTPGEIAER